MTKSKKGAPRKEGEVMKSRTLRATEAQWDKVQRLGGAEWIRRQINEAKEPGEKSNAN